MRKLLAGMVLVAMSAFAQNVGSPVNQVDAPPVDPFVHQYFYDVNNNLNYECRALQDITFPPNNVPGNPGYWSVAQGNLTNITVSGGTATINFTSTSFMWVGMQITVAGSATSALNGVGIKILTVSGTTATFTTSAGNGTYTDMNVSTLNPQINQAVWSIHVFVYTTALLQESYWAGGTSQGGRIACSNRTNF